MEDYEKLVFTRLEENMLDIAEKYVFAGYVRWSPDNSSKRGTYQSFVFPREIGTEVHFDEPQPRLASVYRPGRAARILQGACGVSGLSSPPRRLAR